MDINQLIDQIQQRLANHFNLYSTNEQATRNQLIDPLLRVLGWDPTDPEKVIPNAANEDSKKPDYTLLLDKKPILILEAKNASADLEKREIVGQLAQYCYNMGVRYGILSNGKQWLFYNTFETSPDNRILWKIDITSSEKEKIIELFNLFSLDNIDKIDEAVKNYQNNILLEKLIEQKWEQNFSTIPKITDLLTKSIDTLLKKENSNLTIDKSRIHKFVERKISTLFNFTNQNFIENQEAINIDQNKKDQENSVQITQSDSNYKSSPKKIKVTFPSGEILNYSNVTETFVNTIIKIGVENVRKLNLKSLGVDFISTVKHPRYHQRQIGKYYIMVKTSTLNKHRYLQEINRRLNLGLKIELV